MVQGRIHRTTLVDEHYDPAQTIDEGKPMKRRTPEVTVAQGRLRGRWKARGQVAVFRGVPFAAPPVGARRWAPPAPAEPWSGVREADSDGPTAIQRGTDLEVFIGNIIDGHGWNRARTRALHELMARAPRPKEEEDCLYLTVRTPEPTRGARLPVMVWIHGGDHQDGSGIDVYYASNALARRGVVTVSINYRLGLMGNFAHPALVAESSHGVAGNYGTLDQIAALEWVRENIDAFGGDPENVTIFGESAGGESVMHMMTSPLAKGLFHRAIPQSPGNGGQMIYLHDPFLAWDAATSTGNDLAEAVGASGPDALDRLRAMSATELNQRSIELGPGGGFYPVIDGHVLPTSPMAAFAAGAQADVPLMIGSTADEGSVLVGSLFTGAMVEYRHLPMPDDTLQPEIREAFGGDIDELLALYPGLETREAQAERDFAGDHLFGGRAFWYAKHHARRGLPVYLYMFSRVPPGESQTVGAYHACELPFVHGSTVPIFPMTAADKLLAQDVMGYWTSMARNGQPHHGPVEWPSFDEADPHWLNFDHEIVSEPVSRLDKYALLNARTERLVAQMSALA